MKRTIQIIALLVFASFSMLAQKASDPKIVSEKYDEISRIEDITERTAVLANQTEEMKVALWNENVDRKTKGLDLSSEQKEILDVIRTKVNTVEFHRLRRSNKKADAGKEYYETMAKASQLLGEENIREWFGIMGDSKTLKTPVYDTFSPRNK